MQKSLEIVVQDNDVIDEVALLYERRISDALNQMEIAEIRQLVLEMESEFPRSDGAVSPARRQAAEALRRARRLPVGPDRNDLRQLAIGLLWLDKKGLASKALRRVQTSPSGRIWRF